MYLSLIDLSENKVTFVFYWTVNLKYVSVRLMYSSDYTACATASPSWHITAMPSTAAYAFATSAQD